VQTFLPYDDFKRSAHALDHKRLGKQRVGMRRASCQFSSAMCVSLDSSISGRQDATADFVRFVSVCLDGSAT